VAKGWRCAAACWDAGAGAAPARVGRCRQARTNSPSRTSWTMPPAQRPWTIWRGRARRRRSSGRIGWSVTAPGCSHAQHQPCRDADNRPGLPRDCALPVVLRRPPIPGMLGHPPGRPVGGMTPQPQLAEAKHHPEARRPRRARPSKQSAPRPGRPRGRRRPAACQTDACRPWWASCISFGPQGERSTASEVKRARRPSADWAGRPNCNKSNSATRYGYSGRAVEVCQPTSPQRPHAAWQHGPPHGAAGTAVRAATLSPIGLGR